jgi:hypothetical protein
LDARGEKEKGKEMRKREIPTGFVASVARRRSRAASARSVVHSELGKGTAMDPDVRWWIVGKRFLEIGSSDGKRY